MTQRTRFKKIAIRKKKKTTEDERDKEEGGGETLPVVRLSAAKICLTTCDVTTFHLGAFVDL